MKRVLIFVVLVSLLLSACSQQATPTTTDAEMSTKIAQILTNMPTATGQAPKATATATTAPTQATAAPTKSLASAVPATATQKPAEPTKAPTLVVTPTIAQPAATATSAATQAPTQTAVPATATKQPATNTPSGPTATVVAGDPRNKLGAATWTDKMDDGDNWPTGTDPSGYTEVAFHNGFMELTSLKPIDGWRLSFEQLGNAYLEMSVNTGTCLPKDRYGVIVRVPNAAEANRGYLFGFTCDGKFAVRKWDGPANSMSTFINWKANTAINAGANKTNRLGVMMQGSKLSFYANGVLLGEVSDLAWSEGNFGIFAGAHESTKYTLKVDQLDYWKLP